GCSWRWYPSKAGARGCREKRAGNRTLAGSRGEAACPACGKWSRLLSRAGARRQAVALKHPVERAPVDAQHGRGAAHVAAALLEHLLDVAALDRKSTRLNSS